MAETSQKVELPTELAAALEKHPAAKARFEAMPPSHRREHARVVGEATREETRQRRAEKAIEMLIAEKPAKGSGRGAAGC